MKTNSKTDCFMTIANQTSKNVRYLVLCVFALMIVSCNKKDIDIGPSQLAVSPTSITFGADETTTKEAEVTTNAKDWDFSVETSVTWLTVEKQGNKLRFTPKSKNTASSLRSAEITVTAKSADPVKVTVTQNGDATSYNRADCEYYGDILGNNTAFFGLDLYNSSNPNVGLLMMGFCTLPNSFANFKLDVGTYNIASTGNVKTLFPGMIENETIIGTFLYNFNTDKVIFITSGTMTISLSGNTYTIAGSFAGKDAATGAVVNNIIINFTGTINYIDVANPFPVKSTYKATGKPKWLKTPGDATWTGALEPEESGNDKWLTITNWGNDDITVYCDIIDKKIVIDSYTKVASNSTLALDGYFRVGYINGEYLNMLPSYTYTVNYNPSTKVLDFTGTVTVGSKQYEALVGVAGYNKTTGNLGGVFTDFYADVKLQLTPVARSVSAASQKFGNIEALRHIKSLTGAETRSFTGSNPINIVVDEELRSQIQKIPLKDLKVIENR